MELFTARIEEPPVPLLPVEIKALVRHRDGYQCVECGMTAAAHLARYGRNLDVHRVVPGSPYTVAGSITVCRPCHELKPKSPRRDRLRPRKQTILFVFHAPVTFVASARAAARRLHISLAEYLRLAVSEKMERTEPPKQQRSARRRRPDAP